MQKRKFRLASGWTVGLLAAYGLTVGAAIADPLGGHDSFPGQGQGPRRGMGNAVNTAVPLPGPVTGVAPNPNPNTNVNTPVSTLSFTTIVQSPRSGIVTPGATVAVQDSEWALLWANHTVNMNPAPSAPSVDFTQEQVIAVYLGNRPNGCYGVGITDVSDTATARVVTWKETVPPAGALCPAVISQPIHIIRMPRTDLPVTFQAG